MIKKNWVLLAVVMGLNVACQKPDSSPAVATPQKSNDGSQRISSRETPRTQSQGLVQQPLFFKVTPHGGGPTSYLLGSMHLEISADELPFWVTDLFDRAETVAFEIDMSQTLLALKKYLADPENRDLLLKLYPNAKRNNLNEAQIRKLESINVPRAVAEILDIRRCDIIQVFHVYMTRSFQSMDSEFMFRAKKMKKTMISLEDEKSRAAAEKYAQQQGWVDPSPCSGMEYLKDPKTRIGNYEQQLAALKAYYLSATPEQWLSDPKFKEDHEMVARNHHWIGTLNMLLRQKSAFITFGADHLRGANGIVSLLSAAGFDVEAVDSSNAIIGT